MTNDEKVEKYKDKVVEGFSESSEEIKVVLQLIANYSKSNKNDLELQILAVRRYLRKGDKEVHSNWSWTDEEARAKKKEEPAKTLYAEAKKVQNKFAKENPGYILVVTPIRGFEKQVKLWNTNHTVKNAGKKLLENVTKELGKKEYPDIPTGVVISKFKNYLRTSSVSPEPTSAAPGTSNHGRGLAVDFVIKKSPGGALAAGISSKKRQADWKDSGWGKKLKTACAGSKLKGPLMHPDEPWHWEI